LFAQSLGSEARRFTPGLLVTLFHRDQERRAEIERGWVHNGRLILKFRGVDTRTDAEALEGWEIRIPEKERPPAPPGQYYLSDLIGFNVVSREGRTIGAVAGWMDSAGPALLEVRTGTAEVLVPLVPEICIDVDTETRRIIVDLPEGLEELNRE
jgi:16S rRNA processing protein RimM